MARFRFPSVLTLSFATLAFGAVGCSNGSSPTEPAFDDLSVPVAATSSVTDSSVVSGDSEKRRGGDDSNDDNGNNRRRRGRGNGGNDDPAGDDRGGRRGGRGGNGDTPRPAGTSEFEARVLAVSGNTLSLAGGSRVTVNGSTQWSARGDLFNLGQVSAAVAANRPVRAEGRGTRQAGGSFTAQTLKVEVDD